MGEDTAHAQWVVAPPRSRVAGVSSQSAAQGRSIRACSVTHTTTRSVVARSGPSALSIGGTVVQLIFDVPPQDDFAHALRGQQVILKRAKPTHAPPCHLTLTCPASRQGRLRCIEPELAEPAGNRRTRIPWVDLGRLRHRTGSPRSPQTPVPIGQVRVRDGARRDTPHHGVLRTACQQHRCST